MQDSALSSAQKPQRGPSGRHAGAAPARGGECPGAGSCVRFSRVTQAMLADEQSHAGILSTEG